MTVYLLVWLLACLSVACCDVCVLPRTDGDEFFSTQPQGVQEELCDRIDGDCVSLNVSDIGVLPGYNASVTCPACKCINNGSFHPSTLQCTYDCVFWNGKDVPSGKTCASAMHGFNTHIVLAEHNSIIQKYFFL